MATRLSTSTVSPSGALLKVAQGADLTISSNSITLTDPYHKIVGGGTLSSIVAPADARSGCVWMLQASGAPVTLSSSASFSPISSSLPDGYVLQLLYNGTLFKEVSLSQAAANIGFTPAGGIAATNVSAALVELDTEKATIASPTFTGVVTIPTPFTLGATSVTSTGAELNKLVGVTTTPAQLNYLNTTTSDVQTQINTKAPLAGPTFTGTATIPTATITTGGITTANITTGNVTTLNTTNAIAAAGGIKINAHKTITELLTGAKTVDIGNIVAGSGVSDTITVTGAAAGDFVVISTDLDMVTYPVVINARVSSANTVTINLVNGTTAAINPPSATYTAMVMRLA